LYNIPLVVLRILAIGWGLYYIIEGVANLWYWWDDKHPWYFQVGRVLRVVGGLILVIAGILV
jgi:hypothetical protein